MLRINLLPSYVAQRRMSQRLAVGFGAVFLLLFAGMALYFVSVNAQLAHETQIADTAVQGQQKTQTILANAQTVQSSVAPIQSKVDFVKAVHQYNLSQAHLYWNLANYTDPKITYSDASYAGTTMTIKAYTPSFHEILTFLPRIRQDPDFTSVTIDHVPSYADAYVTKYYVHHTLVAVGAPPGGQSGQGQGGPAGSSGFGSSQGGRPGGSSSFGNGGFGNGSSAGQGSGQSGQGTSQGPQFGQSTLETLLNNALGGTETVVPLEDLIQQGISPLTLPRQAEEYAAQLQNSVTHKRVPIGFFFTVTATLANPLTPPVYGGGGQTGAPAGGLGGPGGPGGIGAPVRTASNG